ncbi:hypothetical protein H310_11891 [Aphanomyces invadans]|uniref:Uncharacterized protein n=1 Tax=Aphanomyces invadans TaxID=157072 RepID=A0A024TLX3_9STRA|nr:hypothetical protein H310_11891 [Aphanomyces invadans]ETV94631.1 hypothetical protein H310_11891 [Aphanomyces invadans]|eukprot:XP_008876946.1 hypothetical protein H310_11891 [Aphanomyces invadans]
MSRRRYLLACGLNFKLSVECHVGMSVPQRHMTSSEARQSASSRKRCLSTHRPATQRAHYFTRLGAVDGEIAGAISSSNLQPSDPNDLRYSTIALQLMFDVES